MMDPISIATCAGSLLVTVGKISQWIDGVIDGVQNVDRRLSGLAKEITLLAKILASVESTMRQCSGQQLTLAHVDTEMWATIHNTMMDCIMSVEKLEQILREIKSAAESSRTLFRRPRLYLAATKRADEIESYRDKMYKSNCAMQTSLSVVNIAISLRNNASTDSIIEELRVLKSLVHDVLDASQPASAGLGAFDYRISQNLRALGTVAQRFHSSASSTASTLRDQARSAPLSPPSPSRALSNASASSIRYPADAPYRPTAYRISSHDRPAPSERTYMFGSEYGGLAEETRQRIERWNSVQRRDLPQPLSPLDETTESSTIFSEGTSQAEQTTSITAPDLEESILSRQSPTSKGPEDMRDPRREDAESDIETDIMADLLSNCEEIALEKFNQKDYYMAEQFLRKAIEESTGENSRAKQFGLLKIRLALCCCLQEKWEAASSALASLTRSKAKDNLPVFHLLHAIALAHLECDKIPEAYEACKLALQGMKKILGKTSADYNQSLVLLAQLCEKRGDSIEAEAVRHLLAKTSMLDLHQLVPLDSPNPPITARAYIETHKTLTCAAFGPPLDEYLTGESVDANGKLETSQVDLSDVPEASARQTTIPFLETTKTGLERAEEDDHSGADVTAMDTGKEFVPSVADPAGLDTTQSEAGAMTQALLEDVPVTEVPKTDTGEEMLAQQILSTHIVSLDAMDQDSRFVPYWQLSPACIAEALDLTAMQERRLKARLDSNDYSDLEVVPQQQCLDPEGYHLPYKFESQSLNFGLSDHPDQEMDCGRVSPVSWTFKTRPITPPGPLASLQTLPEIPLPRQDRASMLTPKAISHARKSPGPVLESFLSGARHSLPETLDATSVLLPHASHPRIIKPTLIISSAWQDVSLDGETAMAIHLGISSASVVTSFGGYNGLHTCPLEYISQHQSAIELPPRPRPALQPDPSAFRDHPQNLLRLIRLRTSQSSVNDSDALPESLIQTYSPDQQWGIPAGQAVSKYLHDVSIGIAKWLDDNRKSSADAETTVDTIIVTVPDLLVQSTGDEFLEMVSSKVISSSRLVCQSLAVVAGFLYRGELPYWKLLSSKPSSQQVVIVLNCEDVLVEYTSYEIVQDRDSDGQSATMSQLGLTKSRLWGFSHAEHLFSAKLLDEKLSHGRRSSVLKPDRLSFDSVYESARVKFRELFIEEGGSITSGGYWDVPVDVGESSGSEDGYVQFTTAEIQECFEESVNKIREMLVATILELHEPERRVTWVLLAGSYASCRFLHQPLKQAVADLRIGVTLLRPESDMDLAAVRGAVCYALHQRCGK